ncbi:HEAT repeat domain-containing protein [Cohnella pontilimi]|uniref:HEAT repeat domain-containing protein n=1 Tax=Cohnella pontilimi TaxID=2564100 RepID=A0A4U0FL49_9BACL|nr:HEAT repeat domain-containing protein [Cohnella pontilimi]TJY44292.1 HEAT repeat domain-containing protein [Cohnella pontilimi]
MLQPIQMLMLLSASLFVLLMLTLVYLILRKSADNRISRIRSAYMEQQQKHVYDYLLTGEETRSLLPHGNKLKAEALEQLLLHCAGLFKGEDMEARIRSYASKNLTDMYKGLLASRSWSSRMNTLYRVDKFDMSHLAAELEEAARNRRTTPEELALIYKLLARWGRAAVPDLLLRPGNALSDYQRRIIFSAMTPELFEHFVVRMHRLPADWRYSLIDVIGIHRKSEYTAGLQKLADEQDIELRIRALKALSFMDNVLPGEQYILHARSDAWQERMMAAKLFASFRSGLYTDELVRLLGDPVWFVRSQAAQSLFSFPQGIARLQEAAATSEDLYAREMAAEWLEKGGAKVDAE